MSPSIVVLVLAQGVTAASCGSRGSAGSTAPSAIVPLPVSGAVLVNGFVHDTAYRALAGARVEVVDGPQTGEATMSSSRGEFSISGTFDDTTRFRAIKDGYITAMRTRSPYNGWVTFELGVVAPPLDIAGDYSMTFVADSSCLALPEPLRTRAYTTTIPAAANASPANGAFGITVRGAYQEWDVIGMGVSSDYVALWFETLVEQITPNTFLSFGGLAAATIATSGGSQFALRFDGSIDYCTTKADSVGYEDCYRGRAAEHLQCQSTSHQLIFTRR
jgi:hypothetical protein